MAITINLMMKPALTDLTKACGFDDLSDRCRIKYAAMLTANNIRFANTTKVGSIPFLSSHPFPDIKKAERAAKMISFGLNGECISLVIFISTAGLFE